MKMFCNTCVCPKDEPRTDGMEYMEWSTTGKSTILRTGKSTYQIKIKPECFLVDFSTSVIASDKVLRNCSYF